MNDLKYVIGAFILIAVFFFWLGGKLQSPEIIEEEKVTETVVVDTATVDSLMSVIERLETIPEEEQEETAIDTADVIDNVVGDEFREITTRHSDSLIVANNYLRMDVITGEITETKFTYILKQRLVRETQREIQTTITRDVTREITRTRTIQEGWYFQVGALSDLETVYPAVSITTRNKTTFMYGYDPFNQGHMVGVMLKF